MKMEERFELSICVIVKNEAPFIQEWLEYHLLIGFQHIYLYDNNSSDDLVNRIAPYSGLVTYIPWSLKIDQQRAAYQHYLREFGVDSQWTAFIDADEFIVFKGAGSLPAYLRTHRMENGIMMQWIIFGTSGHQRRPNGLVIENYTHCHAVSPEPNVKSICQPARVRGADIASPHRFPYHDGRPGLPEQIDVLSVHHYVLRSLEDLYCKLARGDAWSVERTATIANDLQAYMAHKLALYDCTNRVDLHMWRFVETIRQRLADRVLSPW